MTKLSDPLEYDLVSLLDDTAIDQPGDLLNILIIGERNVDVLSDGRVLNSLARAVVTEAKKRGADVLVAASPPAERLIGAALLLAPEVLRGLRGSEAVSAQDVVLVIDVNLASGTAMATTARRVRSQGARHVVGAVLHFLGKDVPSARDCGLDALSLFGPLALAGESLALGS